uniref:Uncharacterized protein n=1 Tax=Anguilla anguilla TaxID=7936 RepID=A0A0E9XF94_ANGAN
MVRPKDDPPTEGVAEVDHSSTAAEAQDLGERCLHGKNEHIVLLKISKVSDHSNPHHQG